MRHEVAGDLTLHVFVGGGWRPVLYVDKVFFKPMVGRWAVFDVGDAGSIYWDGFPTLVDAKAFAIRQVQDACGRESRGRVRSHRHRASR